MRPIPQDTIERQALASNPAASAWVSANAGSGKTHVLTQRVVRLLLEGTPPSKILCLTFTKAAAANMSLRVFRTLSSWVRLDDAELAKAIAQVRGESVSRIHKDILLRARRLFAKTVETPGGLKIQTIHAFCERLLHVFPFEANVAASFEVLAEDEQELLLKEAKERTLLQFGQSANADLSRHLQFLSQQTTDYTFSELIDEALKYRAIIADMIRNHQSIDHWGQALGTRLGLRLNETIGALQKTILEEGIHPTQWSSLAEQLALGGKNDIKLSHKLRNAALLKPFSSAQIEAYLEVFFNQNFEPRGNEKTKIITKGLIALVPNLLETLENERDRLQPLIDKYRAALVVERSKALFAVIASILEQYAQMKAMRGFLDFEDLIERTRSLLSRSDAAWVLYKLDAGIDHILVDEAQDTSPAQWAILESLAADFTAGQGAREVRRTFFAVGDEKQSIFSFQGAAPHMFELMRKRFAQKIENAEQDFQQVRLNLSFRSVGPILSAVDKVFETDGYYRGVITQSDAWMPHEALKSQLPGLVEIWDPIFATTQEAPQDWMLPLDRQQASDPPVILAGKIAQTIKDWLSPSSLEAVHDETTGLPRQIKAGDILILVRSRGPFFEAVIRALKDCAVNVAGADRLLLTEHIAVMDLIAAGRAALLPQDDLNLACVLKSPLIGFDDEDLLDLAPLRKGSLIEALKSSDKPRHQKAIKKLSIWQERTKSLTPFGFFAQLLGRDRGRQKLLSRLGPEAGDAIDEFMRMALAHERHDIPSMLNFLHSLEGADISIKRDLESAKDTVRVMTIHASKGLESKIVFLPDTFGASTSRHDPRLMALNSHDHDQPWLAWTPGKKQEPISLSETRGAEQQAQEDEKRRLLYVAMTRAEERLYISGFYGLRKSKTNWYETIRAALEPLCEVKEDYTQSGALEKRLIYGKALTLSQMQLSVSANQNQTKLPDWIHRSIKFEIAPSPPISPSSLMVAADQSDLSLPDIEPLARAKAALSGRLVHSMLQYLPQLEASRRQETAERFMRLKGADLPEHEQKRLIGDVLQLIEDPILSELFSATSQVEVSIAGKLTRPDGHVFDIIGQVDRLAILPDRLLLADFKTGRPRGQDEIPLPYLRQLALYRAILTPLYPGKEIEASIIWTSGPQMVVIAPERLDEILSQTLA
jgi:ATP-dependent helicase/nuclease subunit A